MWTRHFIFGYAMQSDPHPNRTALMHTDLGPTIADVLFKLMNTLDIHLWIFMAAMLTKTHAKLFISFVGIWIKWRSIHSFDKLRFFSFLFNWYYWTNSSMYNIKSNPMTWFYFLSDPLHVAQSRPPLPPKQINTCNTNPSSI